MKPVAWMSPDGKFSTTEGKLFYIPLYTAPKDLSDDEIADLIEAVNEETGRCSVRIFDHTKVLLRKLKEKYELS